MKRLINGKLMDSPEGIQELLNLSAKVEGLIANTGGDEKITIRNFVEITAGSDSASCIIEVSQRSSTAKCLIILMAKVMGIMTELEDLFEQDLRADLEEDNSQE